MEFSDSDEEVRDSLRRCFMAVDSCRLALLASPPKRDNARLLVRDLDLGRKTLRRASNKAGRAFDIGRLDNFAELVTKWSCGSALDAASVHGSYKLAVQSLDDLDGDITREALERDFYRDHPEGQLIATMVPSDLVRSDGDPIPAFSTVPDEAAIESNKPSPKKRNKNLDVRAVAEVAKNPALTYDDLAKILECKPGTLRDQRKCPMLRRSKDRIRAEKFDHRDSDQWRDGIPDD
jgi:hypothetical protein